LDQTPKEAAREMTDAELLTAWDSVEDSQNLSALQADIRDEIERRSLDL
jgi:hypothetical protein